jgi:folylpolyglutamate synthase/dihydropteroate synthase
MTLALWYLTIITQVLGSTLTAIAAEKGGIFKPGVPAITSPQRADALRRLAEVRHMAVEQQ